MACNDSTAHAKRLQAHDRPLLTGERPLVPRPSVEVGRASGLGDHPALEADLVRAPECLLEQSSEALGRVTEHRPVGARRLERTALRERALDSEEQRSRLRREEARERVRDLRLTSLVKDVQEFAHVHSRDVPTELVERVHGGQLGWGRGRRSRHGQGLLDVKEARVEDVTLDERNRERLWGIAEECVAFFVQT